MWWLAGMSLHPATSLPSEGDLSGWEELRKWERERQLLAAVRA